MRFRAIWPLVDPTIPLQQLMAEARADIPRLAAQAHAQLHREGVWTVAPSVSIPGSGRITEHVLIYDAPASRIPNRAYRNRVAA